MSFNGTNYFANHVVAPQNLQGTPMFNVEVGEGNNPPGDFFPAGYLPALQSENRISDTVGSFFVLMPGKVITYDTNKRLVPAGYILDKSVTAGSRSIKYTAKDTIARTVDATGSLATEGDEVVTEVLASGIDFCADPIGIIRYSALAAPGSDPSDPSTFYKHAYDTGGARAYTRWGYIQVPVVEVNPRIEAIAQNVQSFRISLYDEGSAFVFKDGATTKTLTKMANVNLLSPAATGTAPTQFAQVGRTIFFNMPIPTANYTVQYQPKVDLPFTCLKTDYGASITAANAKTLKDYIGNQTCFDVDSNFRMYNATDVTNKVISSHKVGRILDLKEGSSKDLALVRTYFRDFGLWQEAPGSATDGRNAILSIANAPKYIARIAVNFNVPSF